MGEYKAALLKRHEYAAGAADARKHMKARLAGMDGEIAAAEKDVERLTGWLCVCVCVWVGGT